MHETVNEDARLPKSFRHWMRKHHITVYDGSRNSPYGRSRRAIYTAGCAEPVRFFRALPHVNEFQICDGRFDRWGNSVGASVPVPQTEAEFKAALQTLLATAVVATPNLSGMVAGLVTQIAKYDEEL